MVDRTRSRASRTVDDGRRSTSTPLRPPKGGRQGRRAGKIVDRLGGAGRIVDRPQGCALCLVGVVRRRRTSHACYPLALVEGYHPQRKHRRRVAGMRWTPVRVPATTSSRGEVDGQRIADYGGWWEVFDALGERGRAVLSDRKCKKCNIKGALESLRKWVSTIDG
jgi:hypothetical protein